MKLETHYGKAEVSTYRTNGTPLTGVRAIPESTFTGRPNILMAASIDVQVMGDVFTAAYTEGDNSQVVATDTMKNFIHRESLAFTGSTLEGWLYFLGDRFLDTYPQMERLRVSGEELRFDAQSVPSVWRRLRAQPDPVSPATRRPKRGDAGDGPGARRHGGAHRPARGPHRSGAHQGDRIVVRGLCPG